MTTNLEGASAPSFFIINSNMATSTSPLARQPTKLDYASPTQFRFGIHQLPKVEFFAVQATLPAIALSDVANPTSLYSNILRRFGRETLFKQPSIARSPEIS